MYYYGLVHVSRKHFNATYIQYCIDDKEYLKEMVEHHSMALLTSNAILQKTKDNDVLNLARRIVQSQGKEINEMQSLINRKK